MEEQIPAVPPVEQTPLTPGKDTSEYKMAKGAQAAGTVVTLIGSLGVILAPLIEQHQNAKWAIIASLILAVAGQVSKTLTALGYTSARTEQKTSPYTK
jgi:hypothetical protein